MITIYRGARDPKPAATPAMSWDALCTEITALCTEESPARDKRDLVAIGPYKLRGGTTRAVANVETMAPIAMLDLDGVDLTALDARIHELGISAVVHGTPSDDPNGTRKVRVFVQLDREHAPTEAGSVRDAVASMLGVAHDPATRNADRIGFCGRLADTDPREVYRYDGRALPVDALPVVAAPTPTPRTVASATETRVANVDTAMEAAKWAVLGALGGAEKYDGVKHALCGALGGMLRKTGWPEHACAEVVRAWLSTHADAGHGVDVEAGVRWACAAWTKDHEEVSGRQALDAIVGARAGATIEAGALIPWRTRRAMGDPDPDSDAPDTDSPWATFRIVDRTLPPPVLRYIIPGLDLAPGKVSAIQAFANAAKTPFALLLSICVASGHTLLGHDVTQCPVIYMDHEGGGLTEEREARICAGLGLARAKVPLTLARAEQLSAAMLDELERLMAETGAGLVVIDTYSSAMPIDGTSFNDSTFRVWANALGSLSNRTGVCVLVLVHETKAANGKAGLQGISGHGSLAGALQTSIVLSRPTSDAHVIRVSCARAARKGFADFDLRWEDIACSHAPTGEALVATRIPTVDTDAARGIRAVNDQRSAAAAASTRDAGLAIMRTMSPGVGSARRELIALGGHGFRSGERALSMLVRAGLLEVVSGTYTQTASGQKADEIVIAEALGTTAGFTR